MLTRAFFSTLAALALAGCVAEMPLREGPRARLLPGVAAPRPLARVDVTVEEYPVTAAGRCLEWVAERDPLRAAALVLSLSIMHACARVPSDAMVARRGGRPWCVVAVPEGDEGALAHELRHCEGWDHPALLWKEN